MSSNNVVWVEDLTEGSELLASLPDDKENAICSRRTYESHQLTFAFVVQPVSVRSIPNVKFKKVRSLLTTCCDDAPVPETEVQDTCEKLFKAGTWLYDENSSTTTTIENEPIDVRTCSEKSEATVHSWSTVGGFQRIKKTIDKKWTDDEISDDCVKHIREGFQAALHLTEIGPGLSVTEFLQRHPAGCDSDDDLLWNEADKVRDMSQSYISTLRYLYGNKRIIHHAMNIPMSSTYDKNDPREATRNRWELFAKLVNRLMDMIWPAYGALSLAVQTAMGVSGFRLARLCKVNEDRRDVILRMTAERLIADESFQQEKVAMTVWFKNFQVVVPGMMLAFDLQRFGISTLECHERLGLYHLARLSLPPKWTISVSIQIFSGYQEGGDNNYHSDLDCLMLDDGALSVPLETVPLDWAPPLLEFQIDPTLPSEQLGYHGTFDGGMLDSDGLLPLNAA